MQSFDLLNKLGEGAYSTVFKVRRRSDGKVYALKQVKLLALNEKEKQNALNEVRILASVQHQNVVSYKEAFFEEDTGSLCMVMEYADAGDLYQRILEYQKKGRYMSEGFIWTLVVHMIRGLKALHDLNISHRDLKSANVFLYSDGMVKIGDFNVSKIVENGILFTQTGTPYYASPEVWKDQPYNTKSDIWSMGCVLYEAITLKPPFRAEDMQGLYNKVIKGEFQRIPRNFSNDLNSLLGKMLTIDPQLRPSCDELLTSPLVARRITQMTAPIHCPSPALLDAIILPRNMKQISDRLPAAKYEEERPSWTEPDETMQGESSLPKLRYRGRVGLTPDDRMFQSRIQPESNNDRRKRDHSDPIKLASPSRYHKKILRENYGGLQIVRRNRLGSLSRPNQSRNLDISVVLESISPTAMRRKPRYLSSHARPLARLPVLESHNSRQLKTVTEEDSRKNLSVKSSVPPA